MSASYATARALLAGLEVNGEELTNDEELVVVSNARTFAVLALAEELEALVELLRERLPVPRVPRVGDVLEPGVVYKPALCSCAVLAGGARAYPTVEEWRPDCPAHPDRPVVSDPTAVDLVDDTPCAYYRDGVGVDRCGVPLSEHGAVRDHEWIRP